MLFNSYEFIFLFLPATAVGYFVIGRFSPDWASAWLALASLVFYGWWNPSYVPLLCASIAVNYAIGMALSHVSAPRARKAALVVGLAFNLLMLGYYKYAGFFV